MLGFTFTNHRALMLPALQSLAAGVDTTLADVRSSVATSEGLTPEQRIEEYAGGHSKLNTQVQFALLGIERAGLVRRVRRGVYRLTPEGRDLLVQQPERIDDNVLRRYPKFVEWQELVRARRQSQTPRGTLPEQVSTFDANPQESLESAANEMRAILEIELLDRILNESPEFMEQVILQLLVEMGYGGGVPSSGRVTGGPGDGGVDGIVKEDALGLDKVVWQAKRYARDNRVGQRDLREFAGALDAAGINKGLFVTTSCFTRQAKEYVSLSPKRIVLIDGEELARLLVQYQVGVRVEATYKIGRIDEDFFDR